ncbi:hypothetical protein VSR68_42235 [Paraburkholderia phymatum]|uniref:hypothetical protein n=1 Tax=Paraburkholderia phymatum TaxID=148447 RepID=UPI00317A6124
MSEVSFASFWHGPELSPYEHACLKSFAAYGDEVSLYCYRTPTNVPANIHIKDAGAVVPRESTQYFRFNGTPSLAHFADYFRYVMFTRTDEIWVDTDMLLLRRLNLHETANLAGKETPDSVCTAILRLDSQDPRLSTLIGRVEAMKEKNINWGETGPRLLTAVYGLGNSYSPQYFYPVHFDDYYKVFLPRFADECAHLCSNAYTLHLWNNRIVSMGLFKRIGPPPGSFLHRVFKRYDVLSLFSDLYPESVMETMVHNVENRVGSDEGVRKLLRVGVPLLKAAVKRWSSLVTP